MRPGGAVLASRERLPAQLLVCRTCLAPLLAPVVPAIDRRGDRDEVAVVDAIGDESWRPVADRRRDPAVCHARQHCTRLQRKILQLQGRFRLWNRTGKSSVDKTMPDTSPLSA